MTDLKEARERNEKATIACVLGSVAFFCVAVLALGTALDSSWLSDNAVWLLLPFVGLAGGVVAVFVGAAAWIDARQSESRHGLRQAQVGAILGGIAAGAVILTLIILLVILIVFIAASASE